MKWLAFLLVFAGGCYCFEPTHRVRITISESFSDADNPWIDTAQVLHSYELTVNQRDYDRMFGK